VRLEERALRLLTCLADHAGEILSADELLAHAWPGPVAQVTHGVQLPAPAAQLPPASVPGRRLACDAERALAHARWQESNPNSERLSKLLAVMPTDDLLLSRLKLAIPGHGQ